MQENYLISITGRQKIDDEDGEVQLTTVGSYITKGSSRYIVYKEYADDDASRGQTSILKVDGSRRVTLIRGGEQRTRLILEKGIRHMCHYDTGFGGMMVGVFADKISSDLTDTGGSLNVRYTLDINSGFSSLNEIDITVKEVKNKNVQNRITGNQ